jgi:hypothetical protein
MKLVASMALMAFAVDAACPPLKAEIDAYKLTEDAKDPYDRVNDTCTFTDDTGSDCIAGSITPADSASATPIPMAFIHIPKSG